MIFASAQAAFLDLLARETRSVVLKVIGVTILTLIALWLALEKAFSTWVWPWFDGLVGGLAGWGGLVLTVITILSSLGLALGLVLIMAPVTTLIAGLFLDDVADVVEQRGYPGDRPGQALQLWPSMVSALKFSALVLLVNLVALVFYLIPGFNVLAFFLVNGYLIGREYFEFAATRHLGRDEARLLRSRYSGTILLAGCLVALMLAVPIVNVLTPIFAAAMMVHLFKAIIRRQQAAPVR